MKSAVVLFSGGLDSTTCVAVAKSEGFTVHALSFYYGQKHVVELEAAKRVAQSMGVSHSVVSIPVEAFQHSALTSVAQVISDHQDNTQGIPATYVPARNTIFLAMALGVAEVLKAKAIFLGISAVDYSGYPDCRPEFLQAFQALANVATQTAVEGNPPQLIAPLLHLSKADTVLWGSRLGVDYSITVSCYRADAEGLACGRCDSCVLRRRGFEQAKLPDPTRYF